MALLPVLRAALHLSPGATAVLCRASPREAFPRGFPRGASRLQLAPPSTQHLLLGPHTTPCNAAGHERPRRDASRLAAPHPAQRDNLSSRGDAQYRRLRHQPHLAGPRWCGWGGTCPAPRGPRVFSFCQHMLTIIGVSCSTPASAACLFYVSCIANSVVVTQACGTNPTGVGGGPIGTAPAGAKEEGVGAAAVAMPSSPIPNAPRPAPMPGCALHF